ncbi:peroxiredoxin [Devosia rhodophyticola]|uniref:thioredoxin-dependent peroxiredoxin n=1 Tax=Devosia rhodophyticola TaxID=3026423 RepID=A0ABY7YWG2_9HYPH|nr:peroxiredoxin [Devosia rhodophyticola]WDR05669.1 peroxiredoxin [Devosia rhodophyticola]
MQTLTVGTAAPDFSLPTDQGTQFQLSGHRGQAVVLFFYPQDDTEGCTIENLDFSALAPEFEQLGAILLGISPDDIASHCAFRDKYKLSVALAADPEHQAIGPYDIWRLKKNYGREYMGVVRTSVIVAPDGTIADIIAAPRIKGHAGKVLARLAELNRQWPAG